MALRECSCVTVTLLLSQCSGSMVAVRAITATANTLLNIFHVRLKVTVCYSNFKYCSCLFYFLFYTNSWIYMNCFNHVMLTRKRLPSFQDLSVGCLLLQADSVNRVYFADVAVSYSLEICFWSFTICQTSCQLIRQHGSISLWDVKFFIEICFMV